MSEWLEWVLANDVGADFESNVSCVEQRRERGAAEGGRNHQRSEERRDRASLGKNHKGQSFFRIYY